MLDEWRETVEWIASGWDCIDEYTFDLAVREELDIGLARYSAQAPLPEEMVRKLDVIDEKFRASTVPSNLCVLHCGPQYRAYPNGAVELTFEPYDRDRYWYYYRWQPDSPYPWRESDGIAYQKEVFGLDFENMSESQLKQAVWKRSVRLYDRLLKRKDADGQE